MTFSYAVMEVSARAFEEIRAQLVAAGYQPQVHTRPNTEEVLLIMQGLALRSKLPAKPCGELLVGVTEKGDEVVINHPDLLTDAEGNGHIVFSPRQARDLGRLLAKHAAIAEENIRAKR
jgi:hypothetical protein